MHNFEKYTYTHPNFSTYDIYMNMKTYKNLQRISENMMISNKYR